MIASPKTHWNRVYTGKDPTSVSWYQPVPAHSLALIEATGLERDAPIIDIGGGASLLVDHLLDAGYTDLTVLDIAASALEQTRARLGERAGQVNWIESDVLDFVPARQYSLWHDRAALHFLTDSADRARYRTALEKALLPDGHVVISTFGPDGPLRCSGLEVERYSVDKLGALLGPGFELRSHTLATHETPMGTKQQFLYGRWQRTTPKSPGECV
ncbi:MAG: nodulation S family protein [Gammaproteobacteria bacterium]|nr:nodulation S family protein [Gammaproteobacteria bacterium]